MDRIESIAVVERVATGLHDTLATEFQSPMGRVARAVADIPYVCSVWPDMEWPKTFFVSVRSEGAGS